MDGHPSAQARALVTLEYSGRFWGGCEFARLIQNRQSRCRFGRRLPEEASRAASLLVWSKRDDGSSTLIGAPLNVDGTRCEAPRDAEGFSDAFCRCAAVAALGHTIWMGLILKELLGYNST